MVLLASISQFLGEIVVERFKRNCKLLDKVDEVTFLIGLAVLCAGFFAYFSDYFFYRGNNWDFEKNNPKTLFLFRGIKTKKGFHGSISFFLDFLIVFVGLFFLTGSFLITP